MVGHHAMQRALAASLVVFLLAAAVGIAWGRLDGERSTPSAREPPILAVATFHTLGEDLEPWSGSGLTDEVSRALARQPGIVVRRSPSLRPQRTSGRGDAVYEPDDVLAAMGRGEGADFVLTGTVARVGGRVEIGVRVVRVRRAEPVWTGTFWRGPGDLSMLPDELAEGVVAALPR